MMALALPALLTVASPPAASACSGARVEFSEIRAEATRIVVGTIVATRGDPLNPDVIAIRVEALIRGSAPAQLVLQPPVYMGCDGLIAEPIGTRLVVATGRRFFDAAPPQDLHPYWIVRADNTLEAAGVENPDPAVRTLEDLVGALGGALVLAPSNPAPEETPSDEAVVGGAAGNAWPIPVVIGLLVAGGVLGLFIRSARRR
jgi:hypothetical protein